MDTSLRVAILLDGGFVKKKLQRQHGRFPTAEDIVAFCGSLMQKPELIGKDLFRVYYYDAPPLEGSATNPLDRTTIHFATTRQAQENRALIDILELKPDFAVRRGTLIRTGWKLGPRTLRRLKKSSTVTGGDLIPEITQKGVDIRIGLDIATIALKRIVSTLVLVTGDSDFVAPMKFARTEGLTVYLECMGHGVRRELKAHADRVL
ncbi:MAG: NYN domain-containing protein [bacterium]|nr:NYN domain-containing protein [bacterium]